MFDPAVDALYNNRAMVPGHAQIIARWERDAAAFRAAVPCEIGLRYGPSERMRYDLFKPEGYGPETPLAVFIHGGYWRTFDGSSFSHMARGPLAHGIAVAVATYDLCPNVGLGTITEQIRTLITQLYNERRQPIIAYGHSAGGHLAAMALGTGWTARGLPAGIVPGALAISGLYELEPLVKVSANAELRLDVHGARTESPVLLPAPAGTALVVSVGGLESSEFLRNARDIVRVWGAAGVSTKLRIEAGANHFDVLDPMADPGSDLTRELVDLVRGNTAARLAA